MSTTDISICDGCMKEDAEEFGKAFIKIEMDEEKFFDRISTELQIAAMLIIGFPDEGLAP